MGVTKEEVKSGGTYDLDNLSGDCLSHNVVIQSQDSELRLGLEAYPKCHVNTSNNASGFLLT